VRDATAVTLVYGLVALIFTWPLVLRLNEVVPSDLGDPLFNAWVLAWDASRILRALAGHPSALAGYWQANIFYPHPYTLAYSDHQTAQALQILPVYALTRSPILSYNVAFLLTYVLSGLGMYLLIRELTGSRPAAFVAGLAFAFAPFRAGSIPHAQVLSSEWMPFAFFGFTRYFRTRTLPALGGAALAWVLQNLSCGYYLFFFSLVVPLYVAWELTRHRLWTSARVLSEVAAATAGAMIATVPFLLPYLELRSIGFQARPLWEVEMYSADTLSFLTADDRLRLWGRVIRAFPHPEGWLFPGITVVLLAVLAFAAARRQAWRPVEHESAAFAVFKWTVLGLGLLCLLMLFGWSLQAQLGPVAIKVTRTGRTIMLFVAAAAGLMYGSRRIRQSTLALVCEPATIFLLVLLVASVCALGPSVHVRGVIVQTEAPYWWLYEHVPGWDGLRVPARFGMIVAFALSALAGLGIAAFPRSRQRQAVSLVAAALVAIESAAFPIPINGDQSGLYDELGFTTASKGMENAGRIPPIYASVAALPADAVLLELPLGDNGLDIHYMLSSTSHWRRLVNGYSGGFPSGYERLKTILDDTLAHPDAAAEAIRRSGATHVVLHESQFHDGSGSRIAAWLSSVGGRQIAMSGERDQLFELPPWR
jgi:hypothetical protein